MLQSFQLSACSASDRLVSARSPGRILAQDCSFGAVLVLMTSRDSESGTGGRRTLVLAWLLVVSLLFGALEVGASADDEGWALLRFKASVELDPYGALTDWDVAKVLDLCFWFGVHCEDGKVVALNLKDLGLRGKIAPEIGKLIHLKSLILHNNSFSGAIPRELSALHSLEVLDLGHNNLSGQVPSYLSHLLSLRILILRGNEFIGSMPSDLHELNMLPELEFAEDMLSSKERLATRNMKHPSIRKLLQLANHSPAPAPAHRGKHHRRSKHGSHKQAPSPAPLSPSMLPFLPPRHARAAAPVTKSPAAEPKNQGDFGAAPSSLSTPLPHPVDGPSATASSSHQNHVTLLVVCTTVAGAVSCLLALSAVYFLCWRGNKVVTIRPWATGLSGQLQKAFVTGLPALRRSELEAACEDFSNIIGSLSGCMLYKGTLSSGVEISVISSVVRSAKDWSKQSESEFRKKITLLSRVNHKNFVNLLGYCEESEPFTRMMVFEYAPNGTLFEHLHVKEAEHLDWPTRLRIAMGIAYCVEHMQQLNPPVFLSSIDSSTIYLTDDYAAKLSDMQFWSDTKETELDSSNSSHLAAPSQPESVVHRFGLLLLEILSGRPLLSQEYGLLEHWASCYLNGEKPLKELIDPTLTSFNEETFDSLCKVICWCIHTEANERPTMAEVTGRLRDITAMPPDGATPKVSPLWWAELEIISSEAS